MMMVDAKPWPGASVQFSVSVVLTCKPVVRLVTVSTVVQLVPPTPVGVVVILHCKFAEVPTPLVIPMLEPAKLAVLTLAPLKAALL